MGVCDSVDPGPRLALLARILGEKPPPKVARARRRAETRDSFLEGSLHEQDGGSWSYLKVSMNSHYVERHLCTRIGPRTYAEARGPENRNLLQTRWLESRECVIPSSQDRVLLS